MLSSGMKKYVILFLLLEQLFSDQNRAPALLLFNHRIAEHLVMKSCTNVNIGRQQRHGDKDLLKFSVSTDICVLALDPQHCIILWFHFIYLSHKFFLLYHTEAKKSSTVQKYPSDKSEGY